MQSANSDPQAPKPNETEARPQVQAEPMPSEELGQNEVKEDSEDSQIGDFEEEQVSEHETSSNSSFEFENEEIARSDSDSEEIEDEDERLEQECIEQIFDEENDEENLPDDDEPQEAAEDQESNRKLILPEKYDGPKLKVTLKDYQKTLFQKSQGRNSIIYLPTGLGKTRIAIASMYYYLSITQQKKVVFLANTIQLVKQQAEAIKRTLHGILTDKNLCKDLVKTLNGNEVILDWSWDRICKEVACIHGEKSDDVGQTRRMKIEESKNAQKEFQERIGRSSVIVMIAQMFLNSLRRGLIKLTDYTLVVFDECHHCKGSHPYAGIMNEFYFPKKKQIEKEKEKNGFCEEQLPKIMGLTASPVPNPEIQDKKLETSIKELCINMDSNFAEYPQSKYENETEIEIIKIEEKGDRWVIPLLQKHFKKFLDHQESYKKLETHFPIYFECVKEVLDLLVSRHECLGLNAQISEIHHPDLFLFYDLKQCLLEKLKDLWIELGEYVMCLAFSDMISQLSKTTGLKDEQNEQLLNSVIEILLKHEKIFRLEFKAEECDPQFFSGKLLKLIELLKPGVSDSQKLEGQKSKSDLVLVFAFKRRTVKYLDVFFEKYRQKLPEQQKMYFNCTGVTGYSNPSFSGTLNEAITQETDPSNKVYEHLVESHYKKYLDDYNIGRESTGETKALQNESNRLYFAKSSKFLLQTEEKHASQLKKITEFRKGEKRVLISTSVTEEGFDIPSCNKVISFDTPFSMKSFIQIKGRARKRNSIYYIFTSTKNYEEMQKNKMIYTETINATYEIAVNRIAKEQIVAEKKFKDPEGYQKVKTKSGALLNTNYSLEILKTYYSMLKQPNKGYFHFVETPNIGYKCIIKLPESDPSGLSMVSGETYSKKDLALKSAAFQTVKQLKILGLLKDDLRPSKMADLEEEFQLQKYDDLDLMQKDEEYLNIFRQYAQFEVENESDGKRKFLRVYFKSLLSKQLDFPEINARFENSEHKFSNKLLGETFKFQLYQIRFSNTGNHHFVKELPNSNEIGILTCFDQNLNQEIFSGYRYSFEENPQESMTFKTVTTSLQLTLQQYEQLREIHEFIVAGCENRQVQYYCDLTKNPPVSDQWADLKKKYSYEIDKDRKYYPLMIPLKKEGNSVKIDKLVIKKIQHHRQIFSHIYDYYNIPKYSKQMKDRKQFEYDFTEDFQAYAEDVSTKEPFILLQSISPDFLFHKCVIKNIETYSSEIKSESKKMDPRFDLETRLKKYTKTYKHFSKCNNNTVIQRDLWRNYMKDKRSIFFDRTGIKQQELKNQKFYFLKEFMEYPLSPQALFKATLAKLYAYDAIESYTMALSFRNKHLKGIFMEKQNKPYEPLRFSHYENVVLANRVAFFEYLAEHGQSQIIKKIGKSYRYKEEDNLINQSVSMSDKSMLPDFSNMSGIDPNISLNNQSANQSISMLNDSALSKLTPKKQNPQPDFRIEPEIFEFDEEVLRKINIPEIKKVLTSKTYKHQRSENYEEYEFIGDVILKFLATLETFCVRFKAQEGEMHIYRANIICNANLHKKAIKKKIFRYIMARKRMDPPPPYKNLYDDKKVVREKYKGKQNEEELGVYLVNSASSAEGYQYIPGKVHADVVEALIGVFYESRRNLEDCQAILFALGVLQSPTTKIQIDFKHAFPFQNIPSLYNDLQKQIQYSFKYKGLLVQALTHHTFRNTMETIIDDHNLTKMMNEISVNESSRLSFLSEKQQDYRTKILPHETFYQRLEFLGDAVLDLIVVEHLYEKYERGLDEGTLSMLKQAGVSNKALGLIALKLGLHQLTLMKMPEMDNLQSEFEKLRNKFNDYLAHPSKLENLKMNAIKLLGDIFEGLVGAIFVDQDFNYEQTKKVVWNMIGKYIEVFTDKDKVKGFPMAQFLSNNNYKQCRVEKKGFETKDGNFNYGLFDRKNTLIDECWAMNEKDAWDAIVEKFKERTQGTDSKV